MKIEDGVVLNLDGVFEVYVKVGTETREMGASTNKFKAMTMWAEAHRKLNQVERNPIDAPRYIEDEHHTVTTTITRIN